MTRGRRALARAARALRATEPVGPLAEPAPPVMTRAEAIAALWSTAQSAIHEFAVGDTEEREWEQETADALLALGCTEQEARSGAYRLGRPR